MSANTGLETADREPFLVFRRTCEQIIEEIGAADDYLENGTVSDEGAGMIVEVEHLLERLYDCRWGEAECLKRIVVAIQAQLNNAVWTEQHILFLKDVISFLRVRFLINEAIVEMSLDMAEQHGLDEFRGGVSEPKVLKRYRLEEVTDA